MHLLESIFEFIQNKIKHFPPIIQKIISILIILFGLWVILFIASMVGSSGGGFTSAPFLRD